MKMILKNERVDIVNCCKELIKKGLTNGTSGNVSVYNRDEKLMAISPTGISYDVLKPEDVTVVDLNGKIVDGKKPSSELEMHSIIYRNRDDISAVIHAHTVFCTTLACLRKDLPAVDYMIAIAGGKDVRCAEYATYGTDELAENCFRAMEGRKAVLLANHGLTCGAGDLKNAINIAEQIEYCSELYIRSSSIGEPVILSDEEMEKMVQKFQTYGQVK